MDAIGVLLMGVGGYLMYKAYKGGTTGPWSEFLSLLGQSSAGSPAQTGTTGASATTTGTPYTTTQNETPKVGGNGPS